MDESFYEGLGITALVLGLLVAVIFIASTVWVYKDAKKRGMNGTIVALLVALIGWPLSILVYLVLRPKSFP